MRKSTIEDASLQKQQRQHKKEARMGSGTVLKPKVGHLLKTIGHAPFSYPISLTGPSLILSRHIISFFIPNCFLLASRFSNVAHPFDEMPEREQLSPGKNNILYVLHLLRDSTLTPRAVTVRTPHCLAIKMGFVPHLPIATSLLTSYSKAGDFGSSRALFHEICDKDVIFWNAIITVCVENKCFGFAVDFFAKMIGEGSGFDSTTLLLAVSAFSAMNNLKQGRSVHALSVKCGMLFDSNNLCNALTDMYAKCGDLCSSESLFADMESRDIVSWNSMMRGCLYNNHPEKTLSYFREMASSGERADNVTLSSAIAASASMGEMNSGEAICGFGLKLGFDSSSHTSVANSLISLYSQCGNVGAAETVFREMMCKDVVSWNAMIDGFGLNGMITESFDLLYEMQLERTAHPDTVTIVSLTSICSELMLLREGRGIHGYIIRQQMQSDLSLTNSLIDMYSKCKCLDVARLLFNSIPKKDLVSWNTMISGYSQDGQAEEAQELFKELLHFCSHFSLSTLLAVLTSCASPERYPFGRSIHCWQFKSGFSDSVLAASSLMHMYIYCGDLASAFQLLQGSLSSKEVSCWNTIIVGCTHHCLFQEALETFKLMRQVANVSPDSITFVHAISACGNLELVSEGRCIHALSLKTFSGSDIRVQNALITMYGRCADIEGARTVYRWSLDRNLCSWNCLISAFSQNKDGRSVIELFHSREFEPNEITIVGILSACTQLGVLRLGKQIHGHTLRTARVSNCFVNAALLEMYSNCGRLDKAAQVFQNCKEKTVIVWNSMISASGYHGNGRKAINLFQEMCQSGVRATKSTFVSLLSACSHSGFVDEGIHYYNSMFTEHGVEPVTDHHVCLVDMLGRSGRLDEAFDFIKKMQTPPEPGVWGALLSACTYHGKEDLAKEIGELLFGLEPQNVGYYVSLSNMYVASGRWEEAVELRSVVEERRLKKPAGFSLVDVGLG